ncbi:MAG TPA: Xaa-Pro peptidase family protein [Candidatus Aminicenantes bacterium]|nr:Xaa-Pro peptidase family protein [Candidatus Aminicenantes bacterium]
MTDTRWTRIVLAAVLAAGAAAPALPAQRTGYTPEEFARRRAALMAEVKDGAIVLFGDAALPAGTHFRQDNDFFYFTGNEDLGGVLVMLPASRSSCLFLPKRSAREIQYDGPGLLEDPDGGAKAGFNDVLAVGDLDEYLARNTERAGRVFHVRLSPRDSLDDARSETALWDGRRSRSHYNAQLSVDQYRIARLRERYPQVELRDAAPAIDALRAVKTAEEIEIMRRNGRLSAEAVKQAMLAGRPGVFEYEIEAAAMAVVLKGGAKGAAYAPIVGSGPNSCIFHYERNDRRVGEGEVVLMDFGADLDHLAMDITRTWPASGKFSDEQREVYRIVLEVQKACIAAYRPGATPRSVRDETAAAMKAKGIDPRGLQGGFGHGVGLCVHDVPLGGVLKEGMVMAIEPALYYPEKGFGVRIEDTVLITKTGCEVLTKGVPKEIDEIERLLAGRGR